MPKRTSVGPPGWSLVALLALAVLLTVAQCESHIYPRIYPIMLPPKEASPIIKVHYEKCITSRAIICTGKHKTWGGAP